MFVIVFLLFYKIKVGSEPFLQQRFHVLAVQIQTKKTMCVPLYERHLFILSAAYVLSLSLSYKGKYVMQVSK